MMKKSVPAANPDAYVAGISGWQRPCVESLRAAVRAAGDVEEVVKWGHLVYLSNGPVLLIRAEDQRVLFGFWRGKRLLSIDKRLKASGKYELANLELREGMTVSPAIARRLAKQAIALNKSIGNPQDDARSQPKSAPRKEGAKRARRIFSKSGM
jgi:hypothetical protein